MSIFNQLTRRKNFVKPCDFTKVIKDIVAENETITWVANKDCWLSLFASKEQGIVKINGAQIVPSYLYGDTIARTLPCLYVTRGSVIELISTKAGQVARMIAYGCL